MLDSIAIVSASRDMTHAGPRIPTVSCSATSSISDSPLACQFQFNPRGTTSYFGKIKVSVKRVCACVCARVRVCVCACARACARARVYIRSEWWSGRLGLWFRQCHAMSCTARDALHSLAFKQAWGSGCCFGEAVCSERARAREREREKERERWWWWWW